MFSLYVVRLRCCCISADDFDLPVTKSIVFATPGTPFSFLLPKDYVASTTAVAAASLPPLQPGAGLYQSPLTAVVVGVALKAIQSTIEEILHGFKIPFVATGFRVS